MKLLLLTLSLVVFSPLALAASPKETVTAFHTALQSGDAAKAAALLDPNVTIYESGYVERSRAEYVGHHLPGDIEFAKATKNTVTSQTERIEGNTAVVWQETETVGTFKGKDVHSLGTGTMVLTLKDDRWLITHVHWSSRKAK